MKRMELRVGVPGVLLCMLALPLLIGWPGLTNHARADDFGGLLPVVGEIQGAARQPAGGDLVWHLGGTALLSPSLQQLVAAPARSVNTERVWPAEAGGTTERVNVASDGTQAIGRSFSPSISADGRYVAFVSFARNLVPEGLAGVFVHDRTTRQTIRANMAIDGAQVYIGEGDPSISGDGRYVAFCVEVDKDLEYCPPWLLPYYFTILVHDRLTGESTQLPPAGDGGPPEWESTQPSISDDGRYVAFTAWPYEEDGPQVYVYDRLTGETPCVSVASDGTPGNGRSRHPAISGNGRYVAYHSNATNLGPQIIPFAQDHVYVHDRVTGNTRIVSVTSDGTLLDRGVYTDPYVAPRYISTDGRYVTFESYATNIIPGKTSANHEIFVHDRVTGETSWVSMTSEGTEGDWGCQQAAISGDGRYVAFGSSSSSLVPDYWQPAGWMHHIYVHDRVIGETKLVCRASDGTVANGGSGGPCISADGRFVAFESSANNLVLGDTNFVRDIFVRDQGFKEPPYASSSAQIAAINDSTAIQIVWQDNSDNEDGFRLQRRRWLSEGNWSAWSLLTTTGPNVTQFVDTLLPVGSSYQYRVRAFNDSGPSEWVESNATRCEPTPIWPVGLRAELSSDGMAVDLSWVDRSEYEDRQKIERRRQLDATTWTDWTTIVWLGANRTSYADSDLPAEGVYQYRVRALRGTGASEYSPTVEMLVETVAAIPNAPGDARIVAANESRDMRVNWQDNSDNEAGFRLQRRRWLPEGNWSAWSLLETTVANVTEFVDDRLPVGSSYQYRVRAFNAAGASDWAVSNAARCEPTPLWPIDLQAESRNAGRDLMLSWTTRSDWADRQKIERRRQLGQLDVWSDWETMVWLGAHRDSYLDDNIPGDGKYQYRVRAFRGLGASEYSLPVTVWRLAHAQPAALVSSMSVQQTGGQAMSVAYTLSASADVTLEVRNIAGRLIRTVPQGKVEAGVNTATWNLRNAAGAPVPAGTYLCTLVVHGADGSRSSAVRTVNVQR